MKKNGIAYCELILTMLIFGSIGAFRKYIPFSSGMLAMIRAFLGFVFLVILGLFQKRNHDFKAIKRVLPWLIVSGVALGLNWILLFEAYNYTTVAVATVCYYLAPVLVILVSPLTSHEKLTPKLMICAIASFIGLALVAGLFTGGSVGSYKGILLGIAAAVLYASIIIINKKLSGIQSTDRTTVQMLVSAISLIPYVLLTGTGTTAPDTKAILLTLFVGIVHTGLAYALYFDSIAKLKSQSVAMLSYIDPIVAMLLSVTLLHESADLPMIIGAFMILASAIISELPQKN